MHIQTWQRPSRVIPSREVDSFYESPVPEIHAFLFETERLELPEHHGSFSIKLVLHGEEEYFIGRRTIRLQPGDLLLVNAGARYASRIRHRTSSLALFFPGNEPVAGDRRLAAIEVPQIRFTPSTGFRRGLARLLPVVAAHRADEAEESARWLLSEALAEIRAVAPVTSLKNVRKSATRDELVGRVVRAREFVDDMKGKDCSLDRLARIACLSKYHFLRIFKEVFGCGPAAYARLRRREYAAATRPPRHEAN